MAGRLIVIEGIDGSGTTTQRDRLSEEISRRGIAVHPTAEPSKGPVGQLLRSLLSWESGEEPSPECFALLFAADRDDHLRREVRPALARGEWVISDRYYLSSLAYQSASRPELLPWLLELNRFFTVPDITFFLDLDVAVSMARLRDRPRSELFESTERLSAIRESYLAAIGELRDRGERIVTIRGDQSPGQVTAAILSHLFQDSGCS